MGVDQAGCDERPAEVDLLEVAGGCNTVLCARQVRLPPGPGDPSPFEEDGGALDDANRPFCSGGLAFPPARLDEAREKPPDPAQQHRPFTRRSHGHNHARAVPRAAT